MKYWIGFGIACIFAILAPAATASDAHVLDLGHSLTGGSGDPGVSHPAKPFNDPCGVATDRYGDVYVANGAAGTLKSGDPNEEFDGRIDVFNAAGEFLTEVHNAHQPCSLGLDSNGRLYVLQQHLPGVNGASVVRYTPTTYEPAIGKIVYSPSAEAIADPVSSGITIEGLGVNPANGHLFLVRNGANPWIEDWTKEGRRKPGKKPLRRRRNL
jgi:hypothetical protein